ncbi:uncharacterized protein LOC131605873 [Vicia villosa]|uniref:uncharacterized protein LOC131605873 n=1 Tax=Vicia villosa TaxID=3911 RepID=UPI00273CE97E|nr:uncharacterized protein LOC131605873 [Vicia villosa]
MVNGSPMENFMMQKSLRQGDLLSPFLFVLVPKGLASLVGNALEKGVYIGFKFNDELQLHLLQFEDDIVLLGEGSSNNLQFIKALLRGFELISDLFINLSKGSLLEINLDDSFLQKAASFLNCRKSELPFDFLGIQIGSNHRAFNVWNLIIRNMDNRLASWKRKFLSIGGRITLINSVLNSILIYFLLQNSEKNS